MKEILNIIHKTIYQFFDACEDDKESPMSKKDKLLLEVNKAICNNLKALEQTEPKKCGDCISRQAALNALEALEQDAPSAKHVSAIFDCEDTIKRLPSVEPERKPGKWEWNQRTGEYECSECGCNPTYEGITPDVDEIDKYRFCRWCGARMEADG